MIQSWLIFLKDQQEHLITVNIFKRSRGSIRTILIFVKDRGELELGIRSFDLSNFWSLIFDLLIFFIFDPSIFFIFKKDRPWLNCSRRYLLKINGIDSLTVDLFKRSKRSKDRRIESLTLIWTLDSLWVFTNRHSRISIRTDSPSYETVQLNTL